MLPYFEHKM